MKNPKIKFVDIISFLFITLFVYAAVSKLITYDLFIAQLGKSPLITRYATLLAFAVPGIELVIAVMFLIPRFILIALYASFTLMLMFTLYIGLMLAFSPYVPCSCGGILNSMGWTEHLIFNAIFTLLAVVGIVLASKRENDTITANTKIILQ